MTASARVSLGLVGSAATAPSCCGPATVVDATVRKVAVAATPGRRRSEGTMTSHQLTAAEVEEFWRDGYVVLPARFDEETLRAFGRRPTASSSCR